MTVLLVAGAWLLLSVVSTVVVALLCAGGHREDVSRHLRA